MAATPEWTFNFVRLVLRPPPSLPPWRCLGLLLARWCWPSEPKVACFSRRVSIRCNVCARPLSEQNEMASAAAGRGSRRKVPGKRRLSSLTGEPLGGALVNFTALRPVRVKRQTTPKPWRSEHLKRALFCTLSLVHWQTFNLSFTGVALPLDLAG